MLWNKTKGLSDSLFRWKTGVKQSTFLVMVDELKKAEDMARSREKRGKESTFSPEDRVLILLKYYREYPTQFSLAIELGIHETTVGRIIRKTETILMKSPRFHLPLKKALQLANHEIEIVMIDATESPMERPKKKRDSEIKKSLVPETIFRNRSTQEKNEDTPKRPKWSSMQIPNRWYAPLLEEGECMIFACGNRARSV